jgi:Exostosin family
MATVYLARPNQQDNYWFDYPRKRLIESYKADNYNCHHIVEDFGRADVILYATNHRFPFVGLGIWSEQIFRENQDRSILLDIGDQPSPVIGGLCPSWSKSLKHYPGLAFGWCYHHPNAAEAYLDYQEWLDKPSYLWSFKGSRSTHPVRSSIMSIVDHEAFIEDTSKISLPNLMKTTADNECNDFVQEYVSLLRSSAFVVCPRGAGPSSMRIFESMRAGRAPVIISDDWLPPPFVDWERCSLRIKEDEVHLLPEFLRSHRSSAEQLGRCAFEEWSRVFGAQGLFHHTTELCLKLISERKKAPFSKKIAQYIYLMHKPWNREMLGSLKQIILETSRK